MKMVKKFKAIEKKTDIEWEGEEVQAQSQTKLEMDTGSGPAVVLRFFDFATNLETFKQHKPTAQELFDCHRKGIEVLLWKDGLKPFAEVSPRLMFSKDRSYYRFIVTCIPNNGNILFDRPKTLSELLTPALA